MLGQLDDLLLKRVRPERVGGRVDEVASIADRSRNALDPQRVDAVGRDETGLRRRIGLEPVVAIEREKKAERREIGVLRRVSETIDPFGQRRRELAWKKRIAAGALAASTPMSTPASAPASPGRSCIRPAFGVKPQRSAKVAASARSDDLTVSQFSALTRKTGVASGVGGANGSKAPVSIGRKRPIDLT